MKKTELINLLKTDVKAFNEYRAQKPNAEIDLSNANLSNANLSGSDLSYVDLSYSNLRDTDLSYSNLRGCYLRGCYLSYSNLSNTDLSGSDLSSTDLRGANLKSANLDYSSMPLWCGDLKANYDDKQIIQQLYHVLSHIKYSNNASDEIKELLSDKNLEWANKFHRIKECGKI